MKRLRVIHRLRTVLALVVFVLLVGGGGVLWWANHTGLPDSWRDAIEAALAREGLHAEVASLRYLPMRGIEAGEVVLYQDEERRRVVARLRELLLDVNPSRLSRGHIRLERLDLAGASVSLAVDPEDPESKSLEISDLRGRLEFSQPRVITATGVSGMVGGLRLLVDGRVEMRRGSGEYDPLYVEAARERRRRTLLTIIETLDRLELSGPSPPRARIEFGGDLGERESLRATLDVSGGHLTSRDLEISELDLRAEMEGDMLVVHHAEIQSSEGRLDGRGEYAIDDRRGRFELRSTLGIAGLVERLRLPAPDALPGFGEPPDLDVHGSFAHGDTGWTYQVMGRAELIEPVWRHLAVDRVRTLFSWDGSRLLLEDCEVREGARRLRGRAFLTPEEIRYEGEGDLSPGFYQNAVTFEPLATVLDSFGTGDSAEARLRFRGHASRRDPRDWSFSGTAEARRIRYRGVPVHRARVDMDLDADDLYFRDGEVEFDHVDYALRERHGGAERGRVNTDLIHYHHPHRTVTVEGLRGRAWPAPVVRTFAPKVADHLEEYGFHSTPELAADGVLGLGFKGVSGRERQDFSVRFGSDAPVDYEFLDATLTLGAPRGRVRLLPGEARVRDLGFGAFGGMVRAEFTRPLEGSGLTGELDWTGLELPRIARTYDFESRPQGAVTGRIDFRLDHPAVGGLDGDGHIALEGGELFDVPVFGPLSPVISAVLGRRDAGFQEATDAFCRFRVRDGVFRTADFLTTTPSLVFTGDGEADLTRETLDMTIRMNARGLFGVITLPLRPFYGLFQFRGSGSIENPEWRNVIFTSPPPEQKERLLDPPKARALDPPAARPVAPGR